MNLEAPCPESIEVELEAAKLASLYDHNKHSATCWKGERRKCRLAMPQPQAKQTFFTEICADTNGNPIRKHELKPSGQETISPPPGSGGNAFSTKDDRINVSRLARTDSYEEMQVEFNPITTALLRCNTCTQVLSTESQAKAAAFYIAQYMSKQPYSLQNICPFILQAEQEFAKYGSTATDAGAADRKAKNMLQKIINKFVILEISDQQATAAVLGHDSFICSHKFTFVEPWIALRKYREMHAEDDSKAEQEADENEVLTTLEVDPNTKRAFSNSTLDRYLNRGDELSKYSMYMCALMIGHRKPVKTKRSNVSRIGVQKILRLTSKMTVNQQDVSNKS